MWLVWETAGVICGFMTYAIVLIVQVGFVRIGIWEGLQKGELWAYLNLLIF